MSPRCYGDFTPKVISCIRSFLGACNDLIAQHAHLKGWMERRKHPSRDREFFGGRPIATLVSSTNDDSKAVTYLASHALA